MGRCSERACVWKREASVAVIERIEEPEPRLWCGSLNSSWSVPPQCEYGSATALRNDVSNIKSGLN